MSRIKSFGRQWLATIAFGFLALGMVGGYYALAHERDARITAACDDRNVLKTVVLHLVEDAGRSGSRIDLTAIPSFAALDANTQAYLSDLNELLNAPASGGDDFVTRAKRILVFEDCSP